MPERLLLNARTQQRLEDFTRQPSAAILITGQSGSGKTAVARLLAARILGVEDSKLADYPYFMHIQKPQDKQEISIDAVRRLVKEMRLKPVIEGAGQAKRAILIEDAGNLSDEAQNALLKTIEEPGADTIFILTAGSDTSVLPTIASRTQFLAIGPVSSKDASSYFSGLYSADSIESAWQLSQGAAGLLSALLTDSSEHALKRAVEEAKSFLKMNRYQRSLYLDNLSSDKPKLIEFLDALGRVLAALQSSAVRSGGQSQSRRLSAARRQVNDAAESLIHNASPRLVGLHLALSLPL